MIRYLSISFLLLCCFKSQGESFYDKVLSPESTQRRYDYFISIPVYSDADTFQYVVTSHFLFTFLSSMNKGLTYEAYRSELSNLLTENKGVKVALPVKELQEKWHFSKVVPIASVDKNATQGKEHFIKQYFNNGIMNDGINYPEKNAIVSYLFKWGIGIKTDHETGYLYIPEEMKKKR